MTLPHHRERRLGSSRRKRRADGLLLRLDRGGLRGWHGRFGGHRLLEGDALRHLGGMMIAQMPIGAHRQRAAIPVPQPARNRRNVHAGFDATCCEKVTQIVVGDPLHLDDLGCPVHGLLTFTDAHDECVVRVVRSLLEEAFQEVAHLGDHGNFPDLTRDTSLQPRLRIAAHDDLLSLEIHVAPLDVAGFVDAKSAVGQEPDQIGAVPAVALAVALDLLDEGCELVRLRQTQLGGTLGGSLDESRRIVVAGTGFDPDFKHMAQQYEGVIEGGGTDPGAELGCPLQAVSLRDLAHVPVNQTRPRLQQGLGAILVVVPCLGLEIGLSLTPSLVRRQAIPKRNFPRGDRRAMLGILPFFLLQIGEAEFGDRNGVRLQ